MDQVDESVGGGGEGRLPAADPVVVGAPPQVVETAQAEDGTAGLKHRALAALLDVELGKLSRFPQHVDDVQKIQHTIFHVIR